MAESIYKECRCKFHEGERLILISLFRKDKSRRDGLSPYCNHCQKIVATNYRTKNKEYVNKKSHEWTKNNPDKVKQIAKKYQSNEEAKEKRRIAEVNRYKENGPHPSSVVASLNWANLKYHTDKKFKAKRLLDSKLWRENNKERVLCTSKEWRKNNPDKVREYTETRYGYVKQAKPLWANDELIKEKYNERDRIIEETGIEYHVDHIVPLQGENVCGLHVEYNLRVIEAKENLTKKNALII
jgi:hypothetical protein